MSLMRGAFVQNVLNNTSSLLMKIPF